MKERSELIWHYVNEEMPDPEDVYTKYIVCSTTGNVSLSRLEHIYNRDRGTFEKTGKFKAKSVVAWAEIPRPTLVDDETMKLVARIRDKQEEILKLKRQLAEITEGKNEG